MSTPHQMTTACADVHCFAHNVDEPQPGWLVCFECGHVYPTPRALRRDYRRAFWRAARDDRFDRLPVWRRVWRVLIVRASRVYFCQHCLHNFAWMPPKRRWLRRVGDAS